MVKKLHSIISILLLILPLCILECSPAQKDLVLVSRVIDGDTVVLTSGERVRYIGIDAPELSPEEPFAKEALKENQRLVEGKLVRLERDVSDRDRYGRLLRYVYIDGLLVNAELVNLGLARAKAYPPDTKYQTLLEESEQIARKRQRGIWSSGSLSTKMLFKILVAAG